MKRNRNFLRYFSIFALCALFMLSCEDENESFLPLQINADSNELVGLVNTHRKNGAMCGSKEKGPVGAIQLDESLCLAALRHANDMQQNDYFNHKGQDGPTFSQRTK
jgi:uncharacterized protein YkwD